MSAETDHDRVAAGIAQSAAALERLREPAHVATIVGAAAIIADALRQGGKLLLFGNGGSAADAQHIAAELVGRFLLERAPLPALALADNGASVTAIANDYTFVDVFARQVAGLGVPGDVVLAHLDQRQLAERARRGGGGAGPGHAHDRPHGRRRRRARVRGRRLHRRPGGQHAADPGGPHAWWAISCARSSSASLRGAPDGPRRPSAVFLDRDGVINRKAPEGEYVTRWSEFAFLPGALDALRALAGAPVRVVVATNQRGIARGRMTAGDLAAIHARMRGAVLEAGGRIDAIYHCPHEGGCDCRKPGARDAPARGPRARLRPPARCARRRPRERHGRGGSGRRAARARRERGGSAATGRPRGRGSPRGDELVTGAARALIALHRGEAAPEGRNRPFLEGPLKRSCARDERNMRFR